MIYTELHSSPIFNKSPNTPQDHNSFNKSCTELSCKRYHMNLDTQHAKIYRYNAFDELVNHLQITLLTNLPYINYPSDEIFSMILTGTQLSQVEDIISSKVINFSVLCIKYLNSVVSIFENEGLQIDNSSYMCILNEELNNLYLKLSLMFKFLEPAYVKPGRKRKLRTEFNEPVLSLDSSLIEDLDDANFHNTSVNLKKDRIESLFEVSTASDKHSDLTSFYGIPYLADAEKNIWYYIIYAFKIASKLSDIERLDTYLCYKETWSRWREFLKILIKYMHLDIRRNPAITETLLVRNILKITKCVNFQDASPYQVTDAFLTVKSYLFSDLNTCLDRTTILPIDLTLSNLSDQCSAFDLFDKSAKKCYLGLDSVLLRLDFLQLVWSLFDKLHISSMIKFKFITSIAVTMNSMKLLELTTYYQCASSKIMQESILFPVSFELMRFMFKAWSVTSENYSTDITGYISQLIKLYKFIKTTDINVQKDAEKGEQGEQNELNIGAKKFACLAKFQLLTIMKNVTFSEAEWQHLDNVVIFIENREISLGQILRNYL